MRRFVIPTTVICIIGAGIISFFIVGKLNAPTIPSTGSPESVKSAYWEKRIEEVGGKTAYAEFAKWVINALGAEQAHDNAHMFGGAVYGVEGTAGLSVCDNRFSYGCAHQVMASALDDRGIGALKELDQVCKESGILANGCWHGLGHGLIGEFGYSQEQLKKSTAYCYQLSGENDCLAGVFMEYNLQTMLGEDGIIRPLIRNNWYAPCDSISGIGEIVCYFSLPQWWDRLFIQEGKDANATFARIGQLCSQITNAQMRRNCYEGAGRAIPLVNVRDDATQAIALCNAVSSSTGNRLYCLGVAAQGFALLGKSTEISSKTCGGLSYDAQAMGYCNRYVKTGNVSALLQYSSPEPGALLTLPMAE
jgi:hypothetical protein